MKKLLKGAYVTLTMGLSVVVTVIYHVISVVATATITPVSKAWHTGRLAAEHAFANQAAGSLEQLMNAYQETGQLPTPEPPADEGNKDILGQHL